MVELINYLETANKSIAVIGSAGSGKSTLIKHLSCPTLSIDDYFIGDGNYRIRLLDMKSKNYDSYIDACSMMNWWNWDSALNDLLDRNTNTIIEGAILNTAILNYVDEIIFLYVPDEVRFNRLCIRDSHKRNITDLCARFLLTNYAESLFYKELFQKYTNKIVCIDSNYSFMTHLDLDFLDVKQYIPFSLGGK